MKRDWSLNFTVFVRGGYSLYIHYLENSNGGNVRKWVSNPVFKFQDNPMINPMINKSEIVVLLKRVWVYVEKREFWKMKKKERIYEEERAYISYFKNWHNMSLFINRIFWAYYLLNFFFFHCFITSIYFEPIILFV